MFNNSMCMYNSSYQWQTVFSKKTNHDFHMKREKEINRKSCCQESVQGKVEVVKLPHKSQMAV